jgi:hypothetical protein
MRIRLIFAIVALSMLTACGGFRDSRLNPKNWFGRSQPADQASIVAEPADKRPLVDQVLTMQVESFPGGAIVRATGLPPTQGFWDAELVALPLDESGKLVLEFHIFPPVTAAAAVNQQSREITVAYSLSNIKLEGVTQIVVQGATNARASKR